MNWITALLFFVLPAQVDGVAALKEAQKKLEELDLEAAEAAIGKAIEAHPELAAVYIARARLRKHRDDLQGACEDVLRACELGEQEWKWAASLASAAKDYRRTGLACVGLYAQHKKTDDLELAAESFASAGDFKRAAELFGELIQAVPKDEQPIYRMDRGNLLSLQGDHKAGLKELDIAIRTAPKLIRAYQLRGRVKLRAGAIKAGVADYKTAAKLNAGDASSYLILGLAYYDTGNWQEAVNAFTRATAFRNTRPYTYLYLFLARCRTGVPANRLRAKKELIGYLEGLSNDEDWFAHLGRFLVGEIDEQALLKRARAGGKDEQREKLCEAMAYIGQKAMIAGDAKKAQACFKKVIETRVGSYMEYSTSDMELRRIGKR